MKKPPRPKPSRSNKSSKETTCTNENEYGTSDFNKEESMEDIDLTIAKSVKHPPPPPPPSTCPFSDFKDKFLLSHEGINPHMFRTVKDVLESEMTLVFGLVRSRSGYSFADIHDIMIMDKIWYLYPIIYGKENLPKSKLIGKEFAKGICV
jgi:hypothetical protein